MKYLHVIRKMAYLYFNINTSTSYAILFTFEFYISKRNENKYSHIKHIFILT